MVVIRFKYKIGLHCIIYLFFRCIILINVINFLEIQKVKYNVYFMKINKIK